MFDLVIDVRMLGHGGIGTYLSNLLPYLDASGLNIKKIESGPAIYSAAEQVKYPLEIPPCRLFWSPHFNVPLLPIRAEKRLVTLHDFYHLQHLSELSFTQKVYAKHVIRQAVQKAACLIVVSEFTNRELQKFFPHFNGRSEVIYHGPGNQMEPETFINAPERFFLFVGNLKPHKNLPLLIEAFQAADLNEHLVIVGKKEGFIRGIDIQKYSKIPRVHFLGQVGNSQLCTLYKRATALIFPSLYEGWGFPPLEAMQLGCPVIASRAASIPEACGEAAIYFDPHDVNTLTIWLKKISNDAILRQTLSEKGKKRVETFSWKTSAEHHLKVIEECLS